MKPPPHRFKRELSKTFMFVCCLFLLFYFEGAVGIQSLSAGFMGVKELFHPGAHRDDWETNRPKLVCANNRPVVAMPTAQLLLPKMGA